VTAAAVDRPSSQAGLGSVAGVARRLRLPRSWSASLVQANRWQRWFQPSQKRGSP
jgi:hypothetical protein